MEKPRESHFVCTGDKQVDAAGRGRGGGGGGGKGARVDDR